MDTAIKNLKQLFSPPVFQDKEETRIARLLNTILWTTVFAGIPYAMVPVITNQLPTTQNYDIGFITVNLKFVSDSTFAITAIILLWLIRQGHIKLTSFIFVTIIGINISYQTTVLGGVEANIYSTYLMLITVAALLLGPWHAVGTTFLSILLGYILVQAEINGLITYQPRDPYTIWADYAIFMFLMGSFTYITIDSLQDSLKKSRQTTKKLVYAYQELQEANHVKSQFITMMSHELRTPLNAINGFAELLTLGMSGELPKAAHHDVQLIYQNGQHLTTLIEDILDMIQIEMNDVQLTPQNVEVEEIIQRVEIELRPLINKRQLDFDYSIAPEAEFIWADPLRLKQILYNLIQNAIKFTPQGAIHIEVGSQADSMVQFSIRDTGVGIPKAEQPRLFESFQQLDMSDAREHGGTGLGLSICRELVRLHQGEIWLESEEGQGTTVYFTIPVAIPDIVNPADETHQANIKRM